MENSQLSRNQKKWKEEVEAWIASGVSARKWCLEKQISGSTFKYWQEKFSSKRRAKKNFFC